MAQSDTDRRGPLGETRLSRRVRLCLHGIDPAAYACLSPSV